MHNFIISGEKIYMNKEKVLIRLLIAGLCLLMLGFAIGCEDDTVTTMADDWTNWNGSTNTSYTDNSGCPAGAICRNEEAPGIYSGRGPYRVATGTVVAANFNTVYYPTNAPGKSSAIVFCPPYLTMAMQYSAAWGNWLASHGIICCTFDTTTIMDQVTQRDNEQWRVVQALKTSTLLSGKLDSSRMAVMGWSMGGGATWINASKHADQLKCAFSLAGHNATAWYNTDLLTMGDPRELNEIGNASGRLIGVPTLLINGAADSSILGGPAAGVGPNQSLSVYNNIPNNIPKAYLLSARPAGHFHWFTPTMAGNGVAELGLAFLKTYLDGDTRWKPFIQRPSTKVADYKTNIN